MEIQHIKIVYDITLYVQNLSIILDNNIYLVEKSYLAYGVGSTATEEDQQRVYRQKVSLSTEESATISFKFYDIYILRHILYNLMGVLFYVQTHYHKLRNYLRINYECNTNVVSTLNKAN